MLSAPYVRSQTVHVAALCGLLLVQGNLGTWPSIPKPRWTLSSLQTTAVDHQHSVFPPTMSTARTTPSNLHTSLPPRHSRGRHRGHDTGWFLLRRSRLCLVLVPY
ncbi:hypothetical protein F4825DRAFT_203205 [Nemania diffusa]|nr:hypothetical protein F4825DRAFT_203205 [Nemania diffusa]